jgi:hypothetical protein
VAQGRFADARGVLSKLQPRPDPHFRFLGLVHGTTISCLETGQADVTLLDEATQVGPKRVTLAEVQAFTPLSVAVGQGRCGDTLGGARVAEVIDSVLDALPGKVAHLQPNWLLRFTAADLYVRADEWRLAQEQAELAWIPDVSDTAIAGLLVRIHIQNGHKAAAQRVLDQARARVGSNELTANAAIRRDQALVDAMAD